MGSHPLFIDSRLAVIASVRTAPIALPIAMAAALAGWLLSLPTLPALAAGIVIGPPIARRLRPGAARGDLRAGAIALLLVGLLGGLAFLPGGLVAAGSLVLLSLSRGLPVGPVLLLGVFIPAIAIVGTIIVVLYVVSRLGIATPAAVAGDLGGVSAIGYSWRRLGDGRWRGQLARRLTGWGVQFLLALGGLGLVNLAPSLAAGIGVFVAVIGDLFGRSIAQAYYERVRG